MSAAEVRINVDGMDYLATLDGRDVTIEWDGSNAWVEGEWNGNEIRKCDARFGENVFLAIESALRAI